MEPCGQLQLKIREGVTALLKHRHLGAQPCSPAQPHGANASRASDRATHSRSCACCLAQKQAPTFGAIPSAADLKKKKEGEEAEKVWREEFVNSLLQPEALERLNQLEQNNSAKVC